MRNKSKLYTAGLLATFANLALMSWLIASLKWDHFFGRVTANMCAVEGSFAFGFVLYRFWVWPRAVRRKSKGFLQDLLLYHSYYSPVLLVRVFLLFPLLDLAGLHFIVNTLLGIGLSAARNFFCLLYTSPSPRD